MEGQHRFSEAARRRGARRRQGEGLKFEAAGSSPRFLLYGRDSWGLGSLRRNLTLAGALTAAFPRASALVLTGSPCATQFPLPDRVDVVKLPTVGKSPSGAHAPCSLGGSRDAVVELRGSIMQEVFRVFAPHLLIVDHQVVGLRGEALELLHEAKRRAVRTILGLRDIIDAPETVAREWATSSCRWALREGYDHVCIYGDPAVFDPRRSYPILPELGSRLTFTGYVVRPAKAPAPLPVQTLKPRVLVTTGGGEDGGERIETYLRALEAEPVGWETTIVTGPLLAPGAVRQLKDRARRAGVLDVRRFHAELPRLLQGADLVVSMAGYNTTAELLSLGCSSVLLPRTFPRREQAIRAERLARLGLAETLFDPKPAELRTRLRATLSKRAKPLLAPDFGGAGRVCELASRLLSLSYPKAATA